MRVLLDTHALVWAISHPELLTRAATAAIADPENLLYISAATALEIATKVRIGKFPSAADLEQDFAMHLASAGYLVLPISLEIALRAGRLIGPHKDPFDRMIAAHALAEDMPIISADAQLDLFGIRRIW